jgi:flagellar protein FlaG
MPVQSIQSVQPSESNYAGEERLVPEVLQRAVMEINSSLAAHSRHLSVSMHEATGRHVVTVYNSDTSEIVREIPPARVLDAHANMLEMAGLFVNTRG